MKIEIFRLVTIIKNEVNISRRYPYEVKIKYTDQEVYEYRTDLYLHRDS